MKKTKTKNIFAMMMTMFMMLVCSVMFTACGRDNSKQPTTTEVSSYTELKAALDSECDIIKLTQDIDIKTAGMEKTDRLNFERKVTLDLNGKTITNSTDIWSTEDEIYCMFDVTGNGDLTITGNGKILAKENDAWVFRVRQGAKVTIENGEFAGNNTLAYVNKGKITINGGKFYLQQAAYEDFDPETGMPGYGFMFNCEDTNYVDGSAKIEVKGGQFINFNPAKTISEQNGGNYVAEGYKSVKTQAEVNNKTVYTFTVTAA